MLFSRFFRLRKLLLKIRRDEIQDKFTLSAFTAWQLGAGAGKKFGDYLDSLGVMGKQAKGEPVPEDKEMTAKDAVAKAEEILRMASKKKEKE